MSLKTRHGPVGLPIGASSPAEIAVAILAKIIPLALPSNMVDAACDALRTTAAFHVKPFTEYAVSLVATELPSLKPAVMDKTTRIVSARAAGGSQT